MTKNSSAPSRSRAFRMADSARMVLPTFRQLDEQQARRGSRRPGARDVPQAHQWGNERAERSADAAVDPAHRVDFHVGASARRRPPISSWSENQGTNSPTLPDSN